MPVKLIAVDMDGTFLNSQGSYDKSRFARQYEQLQQRGIKFVVASGNQYYQLKSFFDDLDPDMAYVAENGGYVVDQQKEIYCGKLKKEQVTQIIDCISAITGLKFLICGKRSAYVQAGAGDDFISTMRIYYHRLDVVDTYEGIDDDIFKFALSYDKQDVIPLMSHIGKSVGHIVTPVSSGHGSVDLIIPGNHKANGVKLIQKRYGIADNEVMAFGDGGNDLEMLRHAGFSFAMANGSAQVKTAAKYSALSNDEQGVLTVIDEVLEDQERFV